MKSLIVAIALCFVLTSSVSADRNRKHEGGHNNHQSTSHHNSNNGRHGGYKQKHYYNKRHGHHNERPYVSYVKPYRHVHNQRYYDNSGVVIVTSGIVGFLLGLSY